MKGEYDTKPATVEGRIIAAGLVLGVVGVVFTGLGLSGWGEFLVLWAMTAIVVTGIVTGVVLAMLQNETGGCNENRWAGRFR